jgi:hypothetical protein
MTTRVWYLYNQPWQPTGLQLSKLAMWVHHRLKNHSMLPSVGTNLLRMNQPWQGTLRLSLKFLQ